MEKLALDKKFRKTGGSHIDFHSWGTFWDVEKAYKTAALPGDFFNTTKKYIFNAIF
jgi:hypothetical protein